MLRSSVHDQCGLLSSPRTTSASSSRRTSAGLSSYHSSTSCARQNRPSSTCRSVNETTAPSAMSGSTQTPGSGDLFIAPHERSGESRKPDDPQRTGESVTEKRVTTAAVAGTPNRRTAAHFGPADAGRSTTGHPLPGGRSPSVTRQAGDRVVPMTRWVNCWPDRAAATVPDRPTRTDHSGPFHRSGGSYISRVIGDGGLRWECRLRPHRPGRNRESWR